MAKLKIWVSDTDRTLEFDADEVTVGRDPSLDVVVTGAETGVVSSRHARFVHRDGAWWVEDTGSSNGTYLGESKINSGVPVRLKPGEEVRLGRAGVAIRLAGAPAVAATMIEPAFDGATEKMDSVGTEIPVPIPPTPTGLVGELLDLRTDTKYPFEGARVRMGRGNECELQPVENQDSSVSRVHAEIVLKPDGSCVVFDAKSRNGTLVNGKKLKGERALVVDDVITLGAGGPQLKLTKLLLPHDKSAAPQPIAGATGDESPALSAKRRSFGGQGATQYVKGLFQQEQKKSTKRSRWMVVGIVVFVGGALGLGYSYAEKRVADVVQEQQSALEEQRQALLAQRSQSDSLSRASAADMERLREQLNSAQGEAAPSSLLDSLRSELAAAARRTQDLENSFRRAQQSLASQLAAGDSMRLAAQADLRRLRNELNSSRSGGISQAQLDSLRSAVAAAESQVTEMSGRLRAVRGVDLAAIAQANQGAVGMVTAYQGQSVYDGSGFMLTGSGYFVTNRHVSRPNSRNADSVFIAMADTRTMLRAQIVEVSPETGPDLAVLRIPNYHGPKISAVDWTGTRVRQGEPAALIGLPAGAALGINRRTGTVQTSMSAGIFSKVEEDRIQFDGFTIGGSSGSPVFNGDGEVVAIHYAGLEDVAGLGFAVPIPKLIPLLPRAVKRELNIR